jgi:hypothetical protein
MAVVQKRYAGAEILCIRTKDEKRMIIKCHACAENQGEPDVAIMGVVQKRYACAEILCIRKIPPVGFLVFRRFDAGSGGEGVFINKE